MASTVYEREMSVFDSAVNISSGEHKKKKKELFLFLCYGSGELKRFIFLNLNIGCKGNNGFPETNCN